MPGFAGTLSDKQIAALSGHLFRQFGRPELKVEASNVKELRTSPDIELEDKLSANQSESFNAYTADEFIAAITQLVMIGLNQTCQKSDFSFRHKLPSSILIDSSH